MDLFVSAQGPVLGSSESGNEFLGFLKDGFVLTGDVRCLPISRVYPDIFFLRTFDTHRPDYTVSQQNILKYKYLNTPTLGSLEPDTLRTVAMLFF